MNQKVDFLINKTKLSFNYYKYVPLNLPKLTSKKDYG